MASTIADHYARVKRRSVTNPSNWIHRTVMGVSVADALTANRDVLDGVEVLQPHASSHTHNNRLLLSESIQCMPHTHTHTQTPDALSSQLYNYTYASFWPSYNITITLFRNHQPVQERG